MDNAGTGLSRRARRGRSIEGLTLIEIVVALMVLALGLVSVFALFGIATATHRRGVDAQVVADMAATVMAELEKQLEFEEPADLKDQTHPLFPSVYVYDVQYLPLSAVGETAFLARLSIKWQSRGKGQTETFEKVMFQRAPPKKSP